MTNETYDSIKADRNHWRAEALRLQGVLDDSLAVMADTRTKIAAVRAELDTRCEPTSWREIVQEVTTNAISFAQAFRKRVQ